MDLDALIACGLYDPDAPDAAERLDLLHYLVDEGATVADMVAADRDRNLTSLVTDLRLRAGEYTIAGLAERAGAPLVEVEELYRLLAIPVVDPDAPEFEAREARLVELLQLAGQFLPESLLHEIVRSIGAALTIIAESSVAAFVGSVEGPLEASATARRRAEVTTATGDLALEVGELLGPLLRHHLWAAIGRQRTAIAKAADRLDSQLSVGFVDLVGFTSSTASMTSTELLEFMREFHRTAFDIVTAEGGRVVKHIGDEVMFSAPDAARGCAIGLALVDAFGLADSQPRGGLAHGSLVARHGDFYGPVVNLASRLADVAVPGEILADAGVVACVDDPTFVFEPAGRRVLKGFAEPVSVVSVQRHTP